MYYHYIYINNGCASVFVCGDFNARIGSLDDLTDFDDVNILKRHVLDKTINQHGHSFIDFLNEAKLCILKTGEELNKLLLPFLSFSLSFIRITTCCTDYFEINMFKPKTGLEYKRKLRYT